MASTGEVWKLGHRPALDGVRGIAILLVLIGHSQVPGWNGAGAVGVAVFFTLSGFLITALLLEEHATQGRITLSRFYVRRVRRLAPALTVSTALVAVASLIVGAWFFQWRDAVAVLTYVGNWVQTQRTMGGLTGTWSLAVEEQFYVLWPAVVIICLRVHVRLLSAVCVVGIASAVAARQWLWMAGAGISRVYYGSDMHADALLAGCLLALLLHRSRGRGAALPWAALACFGILVAGRLDEAARYIATPVVVPGLTVLAIWGAVTSGAGAGFLAWRPLRWVGRRSYGLYLYHCPVSIYLAVVHPDMSWGWMLFLITVIAAPLTVLSWRFVEQPFLNPRRDPVGQPKAASPVVHRVR